MDVNQPSDGVQAQKKGKDSGFASAFSFWKQQDDKLQKTSSKSSGKASSSSKLSSSNGRRSKTSSSNLNASETSLSPRSDRSGGLTISSSLDESSTASSTAGHSQERDTSSISTSAALRTTSTRHNDSSIGLPTMSDASESESSEVHPVSPSSKSLSSPSKHNLAEASSNSKTKSSSPDSTAQEGTIAVEPPVPHTSKYWSPSRSRPSSSTPRLGDLPPHMIRSEPVLSLPPQVLDFGNGNASSTSTPATSAGSIARDHSSDSVSSNKGTTMSKSATSGATSSVMSATMSPRAKESPLDRLILSSTSKLRISNDSITSTGSRSSLTLPANNHSSPSSPPNSSVPPRLGDHDSKPMSQISVGGVSHASGASGASMSTVYSGAGSDEPHLVLTRGNDAKDANGAESRTHDDGLHAAGSRSTLSSNASSSADILYRQTQGNISSPGVILTPTAPTPSPTPGTPSSLSIPGASRMLHQMGGSAGALVGRSRDTTGQRQPTTTAADLWSLSEQILLELSSDGSARHSPASSPSTVGAFSSATSARSTEAEDGSSVISPVGSLDAASSMSTSSFGSSFVTQGSTTITTTTSSREETDDSAGPMDASSPSSTNISSSNSNASSTDKKKSSKNELKESSQSSPPLHSAVPATARGARGTVSDLAGPSDAVSSMHSAPVIHRRTRSKDKRDKRRQDSKTGLRTTPEEVEPTSPTSLEKRAAGGLNLSSESVGSSRSTKNHPPVIPLDMRYMNMGSPMSSARSGLDSPSSTASSDSAHFPRRDKGSSRSGAAPSSPGPSKLRVVRQYSSEMLSTHSVTHTEPEPHRFGPRTTSSSALTSSTNATTSSSSAGPVYVGGSSASTTSGSVAGISSSSEDLSSSSSDAVAANSTPSKKKAGFFSSLFSSRKRRTLQLTSGAHGRDFSSADSADMPRESGSPGMSPVYSKRNAKPRRKSSEYASFDMEEDLAETRPRGNSVAEVQHSRHMTSELDDFTSSPVRRNSSRTVLTDLLSPRPGEQINYRRGTISAASGLSMPSSPYDSDEDLIRGQRAGTSSAKSTSEYIGRYGESSNESTPDKNSLSSPPVLKRRNSMDPDSAKNAFRVRGMGNSTGAVFDEPLSPQSMLSPTSVSSSRGTPGTGTIKDSKKKDKRSRDGDASMSPPSPRRISTIFGVHLESVLHLYHTPGRLLGHHHSNSLGAHHAGGNPTSPTISASPSASSLVLTPRTPDGLPPLTPRQDCPELLTTACSALLSMVKDPAERFDFGDTFSTTSAFTAKDKKTLRLSIEDGSLNLAHERDAKMIAQAILTFLEDLPDALCTYKLFGDFLTLLQIDEEKYRNMALHSLIWSLPRVHRATFILLVDFIVSMSSVAHIHDENPEDERERRLEYLLEFFAPAIFRGRSYSSIHHSPRPYMLGELKGTNLSSAFSSAHGSYFTAAVHSHSTASTPGGPLHSTTGNMMKSASGNVIPTSVMSSRTDNGESSSSASTPLTPTGFPAPPLSAPGNNRHSTGPADNSTIGPIHVPRSPRSPPSHFGDMTPLSPSHHTGLPQPTTFYASSASSTGPLHPSSSTRTRHGHSASVSGPSGPTTPKGTVLVPPLQLPSGSGNSGHGMKRSKSSNIYESSEESSTTTAAASRYSVGIPVSTIGGSFSSHGNSSTSKSYPVPRSQSVHSPGVSPPNSPSTTTLSARSIFQAIAILRIVIESHEVVCGLAGNDWMFEVMSGPIAPCVVESGTVEYLFDLLGNQFYREPDFPEAFLLGMGELLTPQEILAKIIARVRSGDVSKPWVRVRSVQLLRALAGWVHTLVHLLAPIKGLFEDLQALIHTSIDEEETQILTSILGELTIAAGSINAHSPKEVHSNSKTSSKQKVTATTATQPSSSPSLENQTPSIDVSAHAGSVANGHITNTPHEALAQHLTLIDSEYLKALKPRCSLTNTIGGFLCSAPFVNMSERFNKVSLWVQHEVVLGANSKERAARVVYFANVAASLVSMNNFNGALAVFTGICGINISRMTKMMTSARKRCGKVLDQLETLFSMTKNSKNYTDRLRASSLPIIPQIVLYARNLSSLDENNVTFEDGGNGKVMNMTKFRDFVKHINELYKYQRSAYYFPRDNELYAYLSALNPPSDDHIYQLSLKAEAKKKDGRS